METIDDFAAFGIRAFTTTRAAGSFGTQTDEPVRDVLDRWAALQRDLAAGGPRLATARQVHGSHVFAHATGWEGWLRCNDGDGHVALDRGTAMAVTIADCTPVFLAHPSGAAGVLHAGWRGTAGRILEQGVRALAQRGIPTGELHVHFGPAICGACYEVSPEVYARLTGRAVDRPTTVDIRGVLAEQARALGLRHIGASPSCTRCDNDRFYSHRAGDAGRQLGVIQAVA